MLIWFPFPCREEQRVVQRRTVLLQHFEKRVADRDDALFVVFCCEPPFGSSSGSEPCLR